MSGKTKTGAEPVTVLLVESGRAWGGTERMVDTLARGLDRERFRPWVVLEPAPALDGWADDLRRAGIPVERLPEISNRLHWIRAWRWLRFLRRHRGAILHVHHVYPAADRYLVPIAHLAGIRAVVVTEHSVGKSHSPAQRWLKSWERSRADITVAVSRIVADVLVKEFEIPAEQIELVPNAAGASPPLSAAGRASLRRAWKVPTDARVWLSVARLEAEKGMDAVLEAWARLAEPRPYLVIAGDGSLRASLEARAEALGLGDRVRFLGAVREARDLYRAADGYVLASRWEGMPVTLLESMAAGLPAVVTDVGGVAEATENGTFARVVSSGNVEALAAAVSDLERDPAGARALGERAARRAAERFGEERMIDAYEVLYRRALRWVESHGHPRRGQTEAA